MEFSWQAGLRDRVKMWIDREGAYLAERTRRAESVRVVFRRVTTGAAGCRGSRIDHELLAAFQAEMGGVADTLCHPFVSG